jgi:hypothetical protein
MSAGLVAGVNDRSGSVSESAFAKMKASRAIPGWNMQKFGRDQIRGLARQTFLRNVPQPVRQVAFSAAGPEIEIDDICLLVGKALTEEREGEVAIVRTAPGVLQRGQESLKATAIPLERKLWLLQEKQCSGNIAAAGELYSYLAADRAEFEYSIVLANPADSNAMLEGARFCDGLVLVLSALHTRRRAALQTKRALEQAGVRLLGTVLADREFPIPHNLYRRL